MNKNASLVIALGVCALGSAQAAEPELRRAETNQLNRVSLDTRFGFNIHAQFKNLGRLKGTSNTRTTPDGANYNYDDGYVLTDISDNFGGQTWNWGYDSSSQATANNTILMSRSRVSGNGASPDLGDDGQPGAEITYNRELGRCGELRYGIEAALNYLNISFDSNTRYGTGLTRTTDAYPFSPGTTPPQAPPAYQGTYAGPGFVIGDTPVSSSTQTSRRGAMISGRRDFDADVWGFRLGPYVDIPLAEKWTVSLSAGLAGALVNASASWNERVSVGATTVATSRGSGNACDFVWGGYVSGKVLYRFAENWSLEGGAQFQALGKFDESLGGRRVELDLGEALFLTAGVSYSF